MTDGIRVSLKMNPTGSAGIVGYKMSNDRPTGVPIPIKVGRNKASCWLLLNQTVTLEEAGYLRTNAARVAVSADEMGQHFLFSYEFDREAENAYPSAHLQIPAESKALAMLTERVGVTPDFRRLHLPVGGVRFRPCLEDVIEFLIVEGIAQPHPNWEEALMRGRNHFHEIQLKAAVRNQPDIAAAQLETMGYQIKEPPED